MHAREASHVPWRLTAIIRSHSSIGIRSNGARDMEWSRRSPRCLRGCRTCLMYPPPAVPSRGSSARRRPRCARRPRHGRASSSAATTSPALASISATRTPRLPSPCHARRPADAVTPAGDDRDASLLVQRRCQSRLASARRSVRRMTIPVIGVGPRKCGLTRGSAGGLPVRSRS
jgi:hypothetical protein